MTKVQTLKLLIISLSMLLGLSAGAQSYGHLTARHTPDWFSEGLSYQIMPRCFSKEGNLAGVDKQLERLKDLGVNIIYFTPLNIADTDMDRSKWSPRQKESGMEDPRNPYRAGDYFHVDSEYGTDQELKDLIDHAHSLGMKVFLDMVFLHCGPSARVVKQHPDYFLHEPDGSISLTVWKFPRFDLHNGATRAYLRSIMTYYVADFNVDGFRCDVADQVPIDFWEEARGELDLLNRDLVIVAEGTNPVNTRYAFDANYSWKTTNIMKDVIHGVQPAIEAGGAKCIRYSHETYMKSCPKRTLLWNMTENHDTSTDSFDDRDEKVYGPAACELSIAYCFAIDGVPLLFCGQEIAFDRRVSMFGNKAGWIDWDVDGKTEKALDRSAKIRKWAGMRRTYSSLSHGETTWIDNDQPQTVCSFIRHDGKSQDVLFVGNFSADKIKVKLADGKKYSLDPWGYVFEPMK